MAKAGLRFGCRASEREAQEGELKGLAKRYCIAPQLDLRDRSGAWEEKGVVAVSSKSERFKGQMQ